MPPHTASGSVSSQASIPIAITICGDGGCGKSSITLRLVRSQWTSEYDPTIEDSYSITRRVDGQAYHLNLTDTAGQEEYRGMWAASNLGADAFLLVYDITSTDSLDALQYFNDLIDMEAETRLDNAARARRAGLNPLAADAPSSRDGPMGGGGGGDYRASAGQQHHHGHHAKTVPPVKIIAGNKCDLQESRRVPATVGLEWARRRECGFMETSARLEVNIEETFALIVRRVMEARRQAERGGGLDESHPLGPGGPLQAHGVTKPLTPLPSGPEGEKDGRPGTGDSTAGSWRRLWSRLRCW